MSSKSLRRKIRRAYSQEQLARICTLPESKFGQAFGMQTVDVAQRWPNDYYHFRDNGANVLAVAHLDTVVAKDRRTPHFRATENGPFVMSGSLDDRLGAYVILDLLPRLGVTCDFLLTIGEERGESTAEFFKPEKDYDHIIEFDRGGTDVVMYQFEDEASRLAVEASGAKMSSGSFSDIAYLEHLGVKAFNWGVGYQGNYHSETGYAYLNNTFSMVAKYLRFHAQNAGLAMPHEERISAYSTYYGGKYRLDDDPPIGVRDGCYRCDFCDEWAVSEVTLICAACRICADCGDVEDDCVCYLPAALKREADIKDNDPEDYTRSEPYDPSNYTVGTINGHTTLVPL